MGRLSIFSEGDAERGLGHLSRCSGFAEQWRAFGGTVRWIVDGDRAARAMLRTEENVAWLQWQSQPQLIDVSGEDIVLIDSYSADSTVLSIASSRAKSVVFLDDTFRGPYPRGLVVHSSPGPLEAKPDAAAWLVGPRWHPMRKPFWDDLSRGPSRKTVEDVLILAGGVDHRRLSGRIAHVVARALPSAKIHVVQGQGASTPTDLPPNATLVTSLSAVEMRELMLTSDLAISAAGQTLYELARCGCPTILVGVAENQARHMANWRATGAGVVAGWWSFPDLDQRVSKLVGAMAPKVRSAMSEAGMQLVDGQGCRRVLMRAQGNDGDCT